MPEPLEHPAALVALGWDDDVARRWAQLDRPELTPARVVRTSRRFTEVASADQVRNAMAALDLPLSPVTGDWVGVHEPDDDSEARVEVVLPRWSSLARRDPSENTEQVLAANVDRVFVTMGLDRPVKPSRVERSLVLAYDSGAKPVIVLTKSDTVDDPASVMAQVRTSAGDAPVVAISAATGDGLDELRSLMAPGHTVVLLGESGAGKSTLANALMGQDVQGTAEVRGSDAKGRHTTVTRDLITLPGGSLLIDTPGLRSLGLWDAGEGLAAAFGDIDDLGGSCRFRDCTHHHEPGCAVQTAVGTGALDADRLDRYLTLRDELDQATDLPAERSRGGRGRRRSR